MLDSILGTIKEIWDIFNGPNNQTVIVGLVVGWVALIISHFQSMWSYRQRLKDKDKEIKRLLAERDKWQDCVLSNKGLERLSTKSESNRREGK